ncbi:unnamed protein product [Orchesella dallaii]|uniref:Uncharacterized protein n=1 Tax=Orchesella dallaii TaxID=48710 RepID=A0ABP1Q179_9HEXA
MNSVSDELVKSKDEMSGILNDMKSKEEEQQSIAVREKTMISEKIREAISNLQELAAERDSALEAQAETQKVLKDLVKTVSELSTRLAKHQHNSINLCRTTLVSLGEEMGPEHLLNDDDESVVDIVMDGVDNKGVHHDVRNLMAALDREEAKFKYVIKAMLNWKIRSEEKMEQLQSRIDGLEKSAIDEKNKFAFEFNKIFEQSKKYKKLVQKLRERSHANPPFEEKLVESSAPKESNQLKSAHATIGHLDIQAAIAKSLKEYEIKPIATSTSSTSCGVNPMTSHLHTSEYKRILDDADNIRKQVDQPASSSKASHERNSKTTLHYRKK